MTGMVWRGCSKVLVSRVQALEIFLICLVETKISNNNNRESQRDRQK
jgi:hypothetical protein